LNACKNKSNTFKQHFNTINYRQKQIVPISNKYETLKKNRKARQRFSVKDTPSKVMAMFNNKIIQNYEKIMYQRTNSSGLEQKMF